MSEAYSEAVIDPTTATPSTPPISRVALFMAAPVDAFASGTQLMIDSVAGAMTQPMPAATGRVATMYSQAPVSLPGSDIASRPAPISSSPNVTSTRGAKRLVSTAAIGEVMASTTANGSAARPASNVEKPKMNWKIWVSTNSIPYSARNVIAMAADAALKRRSRNSD